MIRMATLNDAKQICDIYNYYVLNTVVTFEELPVAVEDMQERVARVLTKYPWLVFEEEGIISGYAYASAWKVRPAYRHTVESSIYLNPASTGKGIGKKLYVALIDQLKNRDVHAIIGGAALPNDASFHLHESLGFNKIGQFIEVGFKFGKWIDVGYWELIFNS